MAAHSILPRARLNAEAQSDKTRTAMSIFLKALAMLGAFSALMQAAGAAGIVGVRQVSAHSGERRADLEVTVWYPALPGGTPVVLGESVFFAGTPAMGGAPIAGGRFPLVLLSHGAGLGGSPAAMSWMAAGLASRGFVVAAPTHPGNGGAHRSAEETMKLWLRPRDIGATLDAMIGAPDFKDHLDAGKVGVLGLSMGGSTALALSGGRIDPDRLAGYCDDAARNPSLCEWVRLSGLDLHALDMREAGRDNRDRRLGFAMAIDPAPVDVFAADSFAGVSVPVEIVNLGPPDKIPQTAKAGGIAAAMPHGRYLNVEDASHFSLFGLCKPGAAEMAEQEKIGDPICRDGGGRSRQDIHAQLVGLAAAAFARELGVGR